VLKPQIAEGKSIDYVYERAVANILKEGVIYSPRGQETVEILNHVVHLEDVTKNVLISPVRDLNYRFMVAEWLWIMFGLEDVESIAQYNSRIREFSDNGVKFSGAYGPKIINQLFYIDKCFRRDWNTRQAVINIWRDSPTPSRDIPCTLSIQFLLRKDKLHGIVTMRSSDAWLGLPYDMFNMSQIVSYVGNVLNFEPGSLTMHLGSSHLYVKNIPAARELIGSPTDVIQSPMLDSPMPLQLKEVLRHPREVRGDDLPYPWDMYAMALSSKTKQGALEILSERRGGDQKMTDQVPDPGQSQEPQTDSQNVGEESKQTPEETEEEEEEE
jgi:thymidylate synthase